MAKIVVNKDGVIQGLYFTDDIKLEKGMDYYHIDNNIISRSDIAKGKNIYEYNTTTWKFLNEHEQLQTLDDNILSKNDIVDEQPDLCINIVEYAIDVNSNKLTETDMDKNDIILSLGITCCDKDVNNCLRVVESLHNKIDSTMEIIVVDNCIEKNVEFPSYVNHIKTGDNIFPFASRIYIVENAKGRYIWFIDGDDSIHINNAKNFIKDKTQDILIFNAKNIVDKTNYVKDIIDFVIHEKQWVDYTLHNIIISSKIAKKILKFQKEKIYYFEDTFYLYYFLYYATSVAVTNKCIYEYKLYKGNMFNLYNSKKLEFFLTGFKKLTKLIKESFNEEIATKVLNRAHNGILWCLPKPDRIRFSEILNNNIDFYSAFVKNKIDYNNQKTNNTLPCYANGIDIVYIFYGKDIDSEISKIKEKIDCNYNLIIIDYFNVIKEKINYTVLSFNYDLTKTFQEATTYFKYNNVWLLESYKGIYPFNANLLRTKTTVYIPYEPNDYRDFELLHCNIIFSSIDFNRFIKDDIDLSNLDDKINKFLIYNDKLIVYSSLAYVEPFDESDITFFFMSFNGLLERDYQSQFCYNHFKKTFPKAKILVFREDDCIKYLEQNEFSKKLLEYRSKSLDLINYENDILRLLIAQDINKSIYVDLDVVIRNKEKFLKLISLYPNMCPSYTWNNYNNCLHNESMWTLGKSKFVENNIQFYDKISIGELIKNKSLYWNGAISIKIMDRAGVADSINTCKVLDMVGLKRITNVIYHWCGSRFTLTQELKNIGIFSNPMSNDITSALSYVDLKYVLDNKINILYIISDGSIQNGLYHNSKDDISDVTTIERYIDNANTKDMIIREVNNRYKDAKFFDVPNTKKQNLNIFTILLDDNIPRYNQECISSWKKYINKVNTINILRLEECYDLYLNYMTKDDVKKLLNENPRKLESIIKENILKYNKNEDILLLENDVYINDISDFINGSYESSMSSDNFETSNVIYQKADCSGFNKNKKFNVKSHKNLKDMIYFSKIKDFNINAIETIENKSVVKLNNIELTYPYTYEFNSDLISDVYDEIKFITKNNINLTRNC